MAKIRPTAAERAMDAHARSRVQQGADEDNATRRRASGTASSPATPDLTGPGGDPAEAKR
jgi:hypothetical protein